MPAEEKNNLEEEYEKIGRHMLNGISLTEKKQYEEAISEYLNAGISAGLILQKDIDYGKKLKCDIILLGLEGLRLQTYWDIIEDTKIEDKDKIKEKMEEIARGPISRKNKYLMEIVRALEECENIFNTP